MSYCEILSLIQRLRYDRFTDLQEAIFSREEAYLQKNLWICGDTSSGKTLVPLLLFAWEQNRSNYSKRMLYLVPYRALAAQKGRELQHDLNIMIDSSQRIAVSTGEYRENDASVIRGGFDAVIMIYEKAYLFDGSDTFLKYFDYIVFDEVGLVNSNERGIKIDLLLISALSAKKRVIVLSTPYYDWQNYVQQFGFTYVEHKKRPVPLSTLPIARAKNKSYLYQEDGNIFWYHDVFPKICSAHLEGKARLFICDFGGEAPDQIAGALLENPEFSGHFPPISLEQFMIRAGIGHDSQLHRALTPAISRFLCRGIGILDPCLPTIVREFVLNELSKPEGQLKAVVCTHDFFYYARDDAYTALALGVRRNQIIAEICAIHLKSSQKILIFINNRTEVHEIAANLCDSLYNSGLLKIPPAPSAGRTYMDMLLEQMNLVGMADELYGVLSEDTCRAILSGIGIHSASLPQEFREYVEEELLYQEDGQFKVVVCTETLAFGINSSVDVVVIADMMNGGSYMTMNEYNNCAGRAGRLRPNSVSGEQRGYIYPIMNTNHLKEWRKISNRREIPLAQSQLRQIDVDQCGLYFLNMFSTGAKKTREMLEQEVKAMPALIFSGGAWSLEHLDEMLNQLMKRNLLRQECDLFLSDQPIYRLDTAGEVVKGYGESLQTYDLVQVSLDSSVNSGRIYLFDLIYHLCRLSKIAEIINTIFDGSQYCVASKSTFWDWTSNENELFGSGLLSNGLLSDSLYCKLNSSWDVHNKIMRRGVTTAAVSICFSSGIPIRTLYNAFKIPYGLLKKLCEQLSYYLGVVSAIAYTNVNTMGFCVTLTHWSKSFFYGVPADVLQLLELEAAPAGTRHILAALVPFSQFVRSHEPPLTKRERRELWAILQELPVLPAHWKSKIDKMAKPFLHNMQKGNEEST